MTQLTRRAVVGGLSALGAAPALAQSGRPIAMLHGFTAGANVDLVARLIADQLSRKLNQSIVVEPRPGAGGTISAAAVARAAPDGATLTVLPGGHAVSAAIYKQLPYNTAEDFSFISMLTDFPFILVTHPNHPAKTVADVIRMAQADPGKLICATAGNGTGMHLALELFISMANAKIQHVPYRGSPQAITDLMGERFDFQMDTPTALLPFINDGKLRAIGVTGPRRFFALPNTPAIAETAVPGYSVTSWLGLAGPPGLPAPFVAKMNADIKAILGDPAVVERLQSFGSEPMATTPEGFKARVADDVAKWTKVVAEANIQRI
ncbi:MULTISPECIES: tripartite tricarboxylate transporter substrate-binding protein [unclassified Beijerinckia]|uniref:tripartite tricarboxylate transporter substrate-binding protein n=1 Tax=unclassified Beijerinckia TaxID=2638183 RepID=UPI0008999FAD|nr:MULTISPECIES: tripartite tricarboxylate transporter substrate-binding protein [unclassified Beijerinckia]MDH7794707.1 tripartite-type tricarboxylate transporter receptor subunit TctC [Beijerinckia sp. GAS462]SEB72113.1 Tripartite-type tricarboxylate transporter, receptor component TctC [Beijerinckia sp. 28-YEA-48]